MTKKEIYTCDQCFKKFSVDKSTYEPVCDKPNCLVLHSIPEPVVVGAIITRSFMTNYAGKSSEVEHLCKNCYERKMDLWNEI